jgi:hypothetical protein
VQQLCAQPVGWYQVVQSYRKLRCMSMLHQRHSDFLLSASKQRTQCMFGVCCLCAVAPAADHAVRPAADSVAQRRFHSWHPTTLLPYLGSCLLLAAFAILHEALASWRVSFAKSNTPAVPHGYVAVAGSERFKEKSLLQLRVTNSLLYTANITTGGWLRQLDGCTGCEQWSFGAVLGRQQFAHSSSCHLCYQVVGTCCTPHFKERT